MDMIQEIIGESSTLPLLAGSQSAIQIQQPNLFDWVDDYILTDAEINDISNPEWIIDNLIISGHITLIPAEPNGGKTTIMTHLAGQMVANGYDVNYVNSDISGGDAKSMAEHSKQMGYKLLLPDMQVGLSMTNVVQKLKDMADMNIQFDKTVFIFDTLKKLISVINKTQAKELFQVLRKLTSRGMTIILLAHTNKYTDNDGMPIYEGTGDMRSDVDEMIYLIPQKHPDGSMTVTTQPDKVRGSFEPITFNIDADRNVTRATQTVNTVLGNQVQYELSNDRHVIDTIKLAIKSGASTQKQIIESCDDVCIGERIVKKVLSKYASDSLHLDKYPTLWNKTKGDKNSFIFSII